jgi:hypothetical protein
MSTPIVNYTVPLCAFERQLLAQVAERTVIHAERQILNELKDKLFPRWSWARLVNSALKDDLKEEEVEEQYHGDKELAYNNFLHFLNTRVPWSRALTAQRLWSALIRIS